MSKNDVIAETSKYIRNPLSTETIQPMLCDKVCNYMTTVIYPLLMLQRNTEHALSQLSRILSMPLMYELDLDKMEDRQKR